MDFFGDNYVRGFITDDNGQLWNTGTKEELDKWEQDNRDKAYIHYDIDDDVGHPISWQFPVHPNIDYEELAAKPGNIINMPEGDYPSYIHAIDLGDEADIDKDALKSLNEEVYKGISPLYIVADEGRDPDLDFSSAFVNVNGAWRPVFTKQEADSMLLDAEITLTDKLSDINEMVYTQRTNLQLLTDNLAQAKKEKAEGWDGGWINVLSDNVIIDTEAGKIYGDPNVDNSDEDWPYTDIDTAISNLEQAITSANESYQKSMKLFEKYRKYSSLIDKMRGYLANDDFKSIGKRDITDVTRNIYPDVGRMLDAINNKRQGNILNGISNGGTDYVGNE